MSNSVYTYKTILAKAKDIKKGVEKEYKLVASTPVYYICKAILNQKKDIARIEVKLAKSNDGDYFSRQIYKSTYLDMAERLIRYVEQHNQLPNYITDNKGKKMKVSDYVYMFSRILVYYDEHGKLPSYANVNSKAFIKPSESTDTVYDYFVKTFGKVTCIDDALEKIAGRGYGYYYDDVYSNRQSIDRIKNRQGVNCTDSTSVFYHIGKALGYEVRAVHVKCRGGDGHIRLQLKHPTRTGGSWINRDPAAVLDSGVITKVWCLDGTILAYQPQWFLQNVNR